jgi:hypothetical protein
MKLACLLSIGAGIVSFQGRGNPFRPMEWGRLPFLVAVKPANLAPVCPAFDARAAAGRRTQPAERAGGFEAGVLKSLGALFVLTLIACGFGAQHIAHAREKNKLGRQLRQKEVELRAATQAYRSLECERVLWVAQGFQQNTVNLARVGSVAGVAGRRISRPADAREAKPAPTNAVGYGFSKCRPLVAEARSRTRRGGTGGG